MQTTLQPPGIDSLSDSVIGSAALRSWLPDHRLVGRQVYSDKNPRQSRMYVPDHSNAETTMGRIVWDEAGFNCSSRNLTPPSIQHSSSGLRDSKQYKPPDSQKDIDRREYYRTKQQRYRQRQRNLEQALMKSAERLHEEITQLRQHRDRLTFQVPRRLTPWVVATEYFRIFRRGIFTHEDTGPNDLEFLNATMAQDVSLGSTSSVDNLVRRWGLFSRYFPDVQVQLKQLKQLKHITEHSLIAFTTTSFTISAASLLDVFPHLIKAREGSCSAQIAAKLRDQHLVFQGSVCFDWDEENKRVIGLQAQVDMVSVLVRMLGSLEDVALMFNNALITPDCNLRSDADFSQNGFAF